MTPAPDTAITLIRIDSLGNVYINTNVANHKVIITKSEREFNTLKNYAFNPCAATPEQLTESFYVPQS